MNELKHSDFMKGITPLLHKNLPSPLHDYHLGETRWFYQVYYGKDRNIHYEINRPYARVGRMLEVGLHFESRNSQVNAAFLSEFNRYIWEIRTLLGEQVVAEQWDRGWAKLYEAYPSESLTAESQVFAAQRLATFIEAIHPLYTFIAKGIKS